MRRKGGRDAQKHVYKMIESKNAVPHPFLYQLFVLND